MLRKSVCCLILLQMCAPVLALVVTGPLSGVNRWQAANGPYQLSGEVQLPAGSSLEIEAGTVILMEPGASLLVNGGTVQALGVPDAPVIVKSLRADEGRPGDWRVWRFSSGAQGQLRHMQFRHGEGLRVQASSLDLQYTEILDMAGAALEQDLASSSSGIGNRAAGNQINAIVLPAGSVNADVRWSLQGIPYLLNAGEISIGAAPQAFSLFPRNLMAGETMQSTLRGKRLSGVTDIRFGAGVSARVLQERSDSEALLEISAGQEASGEFALQAQTDAGAISLDGALSVAPLQALLTGVQPEMAYVEQGGLTLQVDGRNLQADTVAMLDNQALSTRLDAGGRLIVALPPQTQAAKRKLWLRTPNRQQPGEFWRSNELEFNINTPALNLDAGTVSLTTGAQANVALRLPFAAPADGLGFTLQSSAPQIFSVAESVNFAAGEQEKNIVLQGLAAGRAELRISRNAWQAITVPVKVSLPPYQLQYGPAISAPLGVKVGAASESRQIGLAPAKALGLIIGAGIKEVSPGAASVGAARDIILRGQGLQALQSLRLLPADGLTLGALQINPQGTEARINLQVAAAAALGPRSWQAQDATGNELTFAQAQSRLFFISEPLPELASVSPQVLERGKTTHMVLYGRNFGSNPQLSFIPADGLSIKQQQVSQEGRQLDIDLQVAADAASGARVALVSTAVGDSGAAAQIGNSFQIASGPLRNVSGVTSAVLGVQFGPLASESKNRSAYARLGVLLGGAVQNMNFSGMLKGSSGELVFEGVGLSPWSGRQPVLNPPAGAGVTLGLTQVNPGGTQLRIPYQIANEAADGSFALRLHNEAGLALPFVPGAERILSVFAAPQLSTLSPNLLVSGRVYTLEMQGLNLRHVQSLRFESGGQEIAGVRLLTAPQWQNDAQGGKLTCAIQLPPGLAGNLRVRLLHAAGADSASESAANTLTIINP